MVFQLPVPTHIVTGTLGSGKTTAISHLITSRPAAETWAVLVNEFGAVGIDQALLEGAASTSVGGGVTVQQLAGGCLCCALSGVTSVAIAQLVRTRRPSRLLIEPSGLGHPAALLDILRGGHLRGALAVQPVVCLVRPAGHLPVSVFCTSSTSDLEARPCRWTPRNSQAAAAGRPCTSRRLRTRYTWPMSW